MSNNKSKFSLDSVVLDELGRIIIKDQDVLAEISGAYRAHLAQLDISDAACHDNAACGDAECGNAGCGGW